LIALATMLGPLMQNIDTAVANVALPHMAGTFSVGVDEIAWVLTAYLVANAIVLPMTGFLGMRFGRKRFYLSCLVLFISASLGSGLAPSLTFLVVMRVLQGLAGGAMVPMCQAILLESFPREEHGKAMAFFGAGQIIGPLVGPVLGGFITDRYTWPWVFFVNLPVGLIALVLGTLFIRDPAYIKRPKGRVDYWSFLLITVGVGSLEVVLSRGERYDWLSSNFIKIFAFFALAGLALFAWRSLTADNPLVHFSFFRKKEFTAGTLLMFTWGFGLYGSMVTLPLFAQEMLGYNATWAGMILSVGGLSALAAMPIVGWLTGKVDTRLLVFGGLAMNIVAMMLYRQISLGTDFRYLATARLFQSFGQAFVSIPLLVAAFARIRPEDTGEATGLYNLMRNEGGSVGIALASTVLDRRAQFHQSVLVGRINPFDPAYRSTLSGIEQALTPRAGVDPDTLHRMGLQVMGLQLGRQATLMAFVDVFQMLMVLFLALSPLVLLLKKPRDPRPVQTEATTIRGSFG
jgi:DHA2 family multidrug resistance protein